MTIIDGLVNTFFLLRPLNFPDKPLYGRMSPEVKMGLREPASITRDDEIHIVGSSSVLPTTPSFYG